MRVIFLHILLVPRATKSPSGLSLFLRDRLDIILQFLLRIMIRTDSFLISNETHITTSKYFTQVLRQERNRRRNETWTNIMISSWLLLSLLLLMMLMQIYRKYNYNITIPGISLCLSIFFVFLSSCPLTSRHLSNSIPKHAQSGQDQIRMLFLSLVSSPVIHVIFFLYFQLFTIPDNFLSRHLAIFSEFI